jgi:beta-galactosidase
MRITMQAVLSCGLLLTGAMTHAAARPEYICNQLRRPPTIDGRLDEWRDLVPIRLDRPEQSHGIPLESPRRNWDVNVSPAPAWSGRQDLSARIWLGWDSQGVYFAAAVIDDRFAQTHAPKSADIGDSIEIAFDPLLNGGEEGYGGDDLEFTLAIISDNPTVYLRQPRLGEKARIVGEAKAAIIRDGENCAYEIMLPWETLTPLAPLMQDSCGFSVMVNDADGPQFKQWLEWTPGMQPDKAPGQFGRIVFAPAPLVGIEPFVAPAAPRCVAGENFRFRVAVASDRQRVEELKIIVRDEAGVDAWSETREVSLRPGTSRIQWTWASWPDLPKGHYTVGIAGSKGVVSPQATFDISNATAVLRKLDELTALREQLAVLIVEGEKKGQRLAYPRATSEVARRFIGYIEDDVRGRLVDLAEWNADYLLAACQHAVEEARACLADTRQELRVPEYDLLNLQIRDGSFYSGEHPVFLFGSLCWSRLVRDMPNLHEMGFSYVEQGMGPSSVVVGPGQLSWQGIQRFEGVLDQAAQHNVPVDFLLPVHDFPQWVFDAYPSTSLRHWGGAGGFIKECLEDPVTRKVIEDWLRAFIPRVKDKPALQSYILANEPLYFCYCEYSLRWFREWLKQRHGTLDAVNRSWGTSFATWEAVTAPRQSENASRARIYDWHTFNQKRFTDFFVWMRQIIRRMDPKHPLHLKVMSAFFFNQDGFRFGIDREDMLLRAEDGISGVDMEIRPSQGNLSLGFQSSMMSCDLMQSVCPERPIVDSEWHILYGYPDPRLYPVAAGRASLWMSCLHGMNGVNIWVWERGPGIMENGGVLYNAELLETLAHTTLDLRRLMPEMTKLQRARSPIALYLSQASRFGTRQDEELHAAYAAALFLGWPVRFITDRQLVRGRARDYDVIVVAGADYAPQGAYRALEEYVRGGGTLVATAGALGHDEWGRARAGGLVAGAAGSDLRMGRGRVLWVPAGIADQQWFGILSPLAADVFPRQGVTVYGVGGGAPWGVETRVVEEGGRHLVYALNLNQQPTSVHLSARRGRIAAITDLVSTRRVGATLALDPNEVVLLGVEISAQ